MAGDGAADRPASVPAEAPGVPAPAVTVRYWAAARAAAGVAEERVYATTLADALAQVSAAHGSSPRFDRVLRVSSFLVGDQPVNNRDPKAVHLTAGAVVEVLPPFAGGSSR